MHPCVIARCMTHKGRVPSLCSTVVALGDCRQIMLPLCHQLPDGTGNRLRFNRLIYYRLPQLAKAADCVQCIPPDVGLVLGSAWLCLVFKMSLSQCGKAGAFFNGGFNVTLSH
jgi:hypothetical protein